MKPATAIIWSALRFSFPLFLLGSNLQSLKTNAVIRFSMNSGRRMLLQANKEKENFKDSSRRQMR